MYNTSQEYKNAISALAKSSRIKGTISLPSGNVIDITDTDIKSGTLTIDTACVNHEDFELGSMYSSNLNVEIFTDISRYELYSALITLQFGILLQNGTYEYIPLGEFTITEAIRTTNTIKIKAVDALEYNMSNPCNTLQSGTPYFILNLASLACGVELGQTENEINNMSAVNDDGGIIPLRLNNTMGFGQWRQVVGEVAKSLGGFAYIARDGKLYIKRFKQTNPFYLYANNIKKSAISDYTVKYDGLKATIDDGTYTSGNLLGNIFAINSPLWGTSTTELRQIVVDNVWQSIQSVEYTPVEVKYTGDPSIDIGDAFIIRDNSGNEYTSYVMKYSWTHKGDSTIKSVGSNPLLEKTKYTNSYSGTQSQADITSNLFNIMYTEIETTPVTYLNTNLCELVAYIKQNTKAIVHGQLVIDVTTAGLFEVSVYVNDEKLPYITKENLTVGTHSINIFNVDILKEIDSPNYIEVYITSSAGTGTVLGGLCSVYGRILGDEYNHNADITISDTASPIILRDNVMINYQDTYTK